MITAETQFVKHGAIQGITETRLGNDKFFYKTTSQIISKNVTFRGRKCKKSATTFHKLQRWSIASASS